MPHRTVKYVIFGAVEDQKVSYFVPAGFNA
jgi:hypothetical protein